MALASAQPRFLSVPHALRLVGEYQQLLGLGAISLATQLRVTFDVAETSGRFALRLGGHAGRDESARRIGAEFAERWAEALGELVVPDRGLLDGLGIAVDFGDLWDQCSPEALLTCPALSVGLTVVVCGRRGTVRQLSQRALAELASSLCQAVARAPVGDTKRHYGEALLSLRGGASYTTASGEDLNVQAVLPPGSLALVLARGLDAGGGRECEKTLLQALARTQQHGTNVMGPGEEGMKALFNLSDGTLDAEQVTMLYGLLRVRQMTESFLESLTEPVADNDRLAEICDEEGEILADYFGFPTGPYDGVRAAAVAAGALGAKFAWVLGGYPAMAVIAPGRRDEVLAALGGSFPGLAAVPVDVDPVGLIEGGNGPETADR